MTRGNLAACLPAELQDDPGLPGFVRHPVRLDANDHARVSILPAGGYYGFAVTTIMVPITVEEIMPAARHYPIVFPSGCPSYPVAVLGTPGGLNRHVGHDGRWRRDAYVPGWLQRYPFVPMQAADGRWELGIDTASHRVVVGPVPGTTSMPLFDASGMLSSTARTAWQGCLQYLDALERTRRWIGSLMHDCQLVERCEHARTHDGRMERRSHPHQVIDINAYRDLPHSSVLAWHRHGWTPPTSLQLASQHNWEGLRRAA